jgi:hypothetical protein
MLSFANLQAWRNPMTDENAELFEPSAKAKGGKARAASLTAKERKNIAKQAANARWHGAIPRATHEGKVTISGVTLSCAVLEDGRRVLSESGVLRALGTSPSGTAHKAAKISDSQTERLPMFVASNNLRPFIDNDLVNLLTQPIFYRPHAKWGRTGRGLDASLIPRVCEVWLHARAAGKLHKQQMAIASRAEALVRGLAHTGIIALVDEATGYQEVRDRFALQAILDAYLSRELAAWASRFPTEFYQQVFRLRGWTWDAVKAGKGQGPRVIGKYTNDFVYARLAPGILDELQERNPVNASGQRKAKHHQWLTDDVGHPALAQHLHAVIGLMRVSDTWDQFVRMIDRAFPRKMDLTDLPLFNPPVSEVVATIERI